MVSKRKKMKPPVAVYNRKKTLYKNIVIVLVLIALVVGASFFKAIKIKKNEHFSPVSPGSLFYSETAFHYRYARIIAEAKENPLPLIRNDTFVQYPQTIDSLKYYTIAMEFVYGFAYRLFNFGLPFNLFLIYFNCLFSSLPIVVIFLIAKRLFHDDFIGLGAALFYFSTPASYMRMLTAPFLREDFALVFLLLSVWLILILLETRKRLFLSFLLGILVVLSLSSWHFSQFVYICMVPFFYWIVLRRPQLLKNFLIPFLILFIAGFFVPVLKTRIFSTSILMCSFYAIFIGYFLVRYSRKLSLRAAVIAGIFIGIVGARNTFGLYEPAYSHVFGLFFEKLRFFLQKPDNPLLLSFNARQLWEGAFNSPTLRDLWRAGRFTVALGIAGGVLLLWRSRRKPSGESLLAMVSLSLFLLSLMIRRILMVVAPFVSIALWGCLSDGERSRRFGKIALVLFLSFNFIGINLGPKHGARFTPSSFRQLCEWIKENTQADDAILARIPVNPMILLNTGRREVLHPKFENLAIRKKYKEFTEAVYSTDETVLYAFCRENKAKYFVYDWAFFIPDSKDSVRYLAGKLPSISEKIIAARLHFCSPELKHFRPLYRNSSFIVFKVVEGKDDFPVEKLPYSPVYDPDLFPKENGFYKRT
ncbi:hypothetical protein ACFL2W_01215, partial [Candidatus Omnitrophota bacterium]